MRAEESRVIVVAPLGHDAEAMATLLGEQGVVAKACTRAGDCIELLEGGVGAVVVTEEALELPGAEELLEGFTRQPAWSELPLIVLTSGGEWRSARLLEIAAEVAGGITVLERPMRAGTLLHSVQVALRSRQRQYQVRDLLAERDRREEVLQESERRVRTFFASEMMGAIYWTMDGGITDANHKFLQMVGYTREDLDSGRVNWAQMTPVEYAERDDYALEELRSKGVDTPYEKEFTRKDGTRVPILIGAAMVDNDRREGVGFVLDITERKKAEEALRRSEERLRTVMETAQVAILVAHDPECRNITGNAMAHAVLGVPMKGNLSGTPSAPANVPWHAMSRGRELAGDELPIQRAARTGQIIRDLELEVVQATGERASILATAAPLREASGRITGAVGTLLDITERKRAEEALRQANERLSYHVHNTPLGVIEFDSELKISAWGDGAERIFGWKAAEVLGRRMWEIPWIWEEDRQKLELASAGLESGKTVRNVSLNRNLRKDGKLIWCEWYNSSLTDRSGKMRSIQSLVLDVTAKKEAEAVLARDREQLEKLVAERTAALRDLVGELEHFSYSITHDMRAPLRAMMGFAGAAKELSLTSEQQEQKMFLDRIQTAAKRMDLLITDALNYSKAVRSELPLAPVDLGPLLRGMLDTYPELQGASHGIRIDPDLPPVLGNEAGLTQCFSNLLNNAVKFAKPGEQPDVRVWAEVFRPEPSSLNSQPQQWVRIWVEDRGVGIGRKMLPRVFDMFARGSSHQSGTGIGLALVRKVAERMGGRVGVESEEGRGSRFWLELRSGF